MHILDPDLEADSCLGDGLHLYDLTSFHTIEQAIACFLVCNRYLACGEGTSLKCCNVIFATSDYGMTIITLCRLYFMLSCQLAPTDALSM
jgi:hypothetical protein